MDKDVDKNNWKKLEEVAINAGYRDGISDGREQNFQCGFNKGYKLGYETGFTLGFYKGASKHQQNNLKSNPILAKSMTGNCQLCNIKNLENEEMLRLEQIQTENYEKIAKQLKEELPEIEIK